MQELQDLGGIGKQLDLRVHRSERPAALGRPLVRLWAARMNNLLIGCNHLAQADGFMTGRHWSLHRNEKFVNPLFDLLPLIGFQILQVLVQGLKTEGCARRPSQTT